MLRLLLKTFFIIFVPAFFITFTMLLAKDDFSANSNEVNVGLAYQRLDSLRDNQKIILIAGSSGSWSTCSQMLVDAFHLPVVNTCSHAGMGMRMQFELYKQFMRDGDIVVFFPEYYGGLGSLYGESTLVRALSTHLPSKYTLFSFNQWKHCFKYIGIHFVECIKDRGRKATEGPYAPQSVNKYGDIDCDRPHGEITDHYGVRDSLDSDALDYIKYIHQYTKEKGIKLIFLPPTFMERNYREEEKHINSLYSYYKEKGIPYQALPKRYMFPDSLYCNTPYHMTAEGTKLRTKLLIEDMMFYIKNSNRN